MSNRRKGVNVIKMLEEWSSKTMELIKGQVPASNFIPSLDVDDNKFDDLAPVNLYNVSSIETSEKISTVVFQCQLKGFTLTERALLNVALLTGSNIDKLTVFICVVYFDYLWNKNVYAVDGLLTWDFLLTRFFTNHGKVMFPNDAFFSEAIEAQKYRIDPNDVFDICYSVYTLK